MQYSKEFDGFNLMNLSFQEREKLLKEQFSREKEKILKRRVLLFFPFFRGRGWVGREREFSMNQF